MRLIAPPGVYAPQDDTALLAEAVCREPAMPGAQVLDIGTGTGALALLAARCGAAGVDAVDVSARAVLAAWLNTRRSGEPVRVRLGDLASVAAGRRFDVVLANPPYVPSRRGGRFGRAGGGRAWNAGPDGRAALDRLCARIPGLLRPGRATARPVRAERSRYDAGAAGSAGAARGCDRAPRRPVRARAAAAWPLAGLPGADRPG